MRIYYLPYPKVVLHNFYINGHTSKKRSCVTWGKESDFLQRPTEHRDAQKNAYGNDIKWKVCLGPCQTSINSFLFHLLILYPLKKSEIQEFSGVSRGFKLGTLVWNGLRTFSWWYTAWKVFVFGVFLVHIFLHLDWKRDSVRMGENTDQKNSEFGHFSRTE